MKDFLKYTAATVTGLLAFTVIIAAIGMMSIVGMIASSESSGPVEDNSVLVIPLTGSLQERAEDNILSRIAGQTGAEVGLDEILDGIRKAKDNENIKGIYIEAGAFQADSYASLQAIRKSLLDFRKSGKWIVAYGDSYTQATYYIASVADKVMLNPQGVIDWHGIASQQFYLKDMMAKFGVRMQLAKVGAYKSAPEMFTAD